ncbi:DUF1493 family protein [Bacteroides oleiciplenus]|uniref:DUF1493 family protein n=1 Tax=Bacteroides oleiciplenus YIT 12058 TaxID=742727 RepID=K9E6W1_9BACE|nr:DUF1493 family protein [Bacteroides oleiciplenus]EKU91611.1 hypothetical protein HMPREF9447_01325 [Bacteroides oleiciplenus YIT 12058]
MKNENIILLREFIESQGIMCESYLRETTLLERDLRITGNDAVEFILAFGKKFNVDVSKFRLDEYFEAEGILGLFFPFFYKYINSPSKKKITIKELLDAMESHVLNPNGMM